MIHEIAEIHVVGGREKEFEIAVARAVPLFQRSRGCRGMELQRTIETPTKYRLVVQWDTVEDHMVHFRGSPEFQEWRRLVGAFFQGGPPLVDHTERVVHGF
jgi:heme-degrading monooxygenase HmoA